MISQFWVYIAILSLYLISEFISRNSEFISQFRVYISQCIILSHFINFFLPESAFWSYENIISEHSKHSVFQSFKNIFPYVNINGPFHCIVMRTQLLNALIQVATFKKTLDEHQTKMFQKKFHEQCMNTVFMLTFSEHYRQQNFERTFY